MIVNGVYQLEGTERVERVEEKVDCGTCVTTSYFAADGTLLRVDKEIKVSEEVMRELVKLIEGGQG